MERKMKKLISIVVITMFSVLFFMGCGSNETNETNETSTPVEETTSEDEAEDAGEVTVRVFAAASMTEALGEIAELYIAENPGVTIEFNFDSSGTLQTQIENGAEADIFLSAATKQMTELAENGYVNEATQRDLLINKVVLIVPEDAETEMTSFEDVATDMLSLIALGNADVPCGQYAQEIFTSLGVWEVVEAKASFGENVKAILSQVESGSVDAGVVYATDAKTSTNGVRIVAESPQGSHSPVVYPAAVLSEAEDETAAIAFLEYLSSQAAVSVFERIGFTMAN